uniref:Uncharacterized protein n=1 Tax=Moniliophthora roreri TaxID=221103 RepID=A0A0W0F480_MONRR
MLKHKSSAIHISQLSKSELNSPSSNTTFLTTTNHAQEEPLFTQPRKRERTESCVTIKGSSHSRSQSQSKKENGKENGNKLKKRGRDADGEADKKRRKTSLEDQVLEDKASGEKSVVPFPSEPQSQPKKSATAASAPVLMPTRAAPSVPVLTISQPRTPSHTHTHSKSNSQSRIPVRTHYNFHTPFQPFPSSYIYNPPTTTPGPWKDQWGNIHPTASELDLTIEFYKKSPFFDVWDLDAGTGSEEVWIGIPARAHLTPPPKWKGTLAPEPDVRFVGIECQSFEYSGSGLGVFDPEYVVRYTGHSCPSSSSTPDLQGKGVLVTKKWSKKPPAQGKGRIITSLPGRQYLPSDSLVGIDSEDEDTVRGGWYFRFVVPVPMSLIRAGNARAFTVEVRLALGEEGEELLVAEKEMVVSHLKTEEEMKGRVL